MRSLPLFHRVTGQKVIVLGEGQAADAKRRLVERAGGEAVTELQQGIDLGARLAFVAHDDGGACEADAARLRAAGLLVNVVDRPDLCDFTTPSILDRDPVLLAVGTSGASAGLAKQLRLRLEALLPADLGRLAERLQQARAALRARWPDAGERRRALDAALGPGGALDPLSGDAVERFEPWLDASEARHPGQVIEIELASDDPDDLTLRQLRILGSADIVECDQTVAPEILERARADAVRRPLSSAESLTNGLVVRLTKKMR